MSGPVTGANGAAPLPPAAGAPNPPLPNPLDARVNNAAAGALDASRKDREEAPPSCCHRFWSVILFPFSWVPWLISKIRECCSNLFFDREIDDDPVPPRPIPPKPSGPHRGPLMQMPSLKLALSKLLAAEIKGIKALAGVSRAKQSMAHLQGQRDRHVAALDEMKAKVAAGDKAITTAQIQTLEKDILAVNKLLEVCHKAWQEKAETFKAEFLKQIGDQQKKLTDRFTPESLQKEPAAGDEVKGYSTYMDLYEQAVEMGFEEGVDAAAHKKLLECRPLLKDAFGFNNLGNTCWMNAALQACLGFEIIRDKIKADLEQGYAETEVWHKRRMASHDNKKPVKREAETYEDFAVRIQDFADKYPVKRSAKVEKVLFELRKEIHAGLVPEREDKEEEDAFAAREKAHAATAPKLANAETGDEFKARCKKHGFYDKHQASQEQRYLQGTPGFKVVKGSDWTIEMLSAETDADLKFRTDQHEKDADRKMESDSNFAKRQMIHKALRVFLEAWETGSVPLKDALEGVRKALADSKINVDFELASFGRQNCSGAFTRILMEVLGIQLQMIKANSVDGVEWEPVVLPNNDLPILLVEMLGSAEKISDGVALIKHVFQPRQNDTNGKYKKTLGYQSRMRLNTVPDILPVHFNRLVKVGPGERPDAEEAVERIITGVLPQIAEVMGPLENDRTHKAVKAFYRTLAVSADEKIDRKLKFDSFEMDLTEIFDKDAADGEPVKYRVMGFTVHEGGAGGGHYVAYRLCEDGKWRYYSDTTVKVIEDEKKVLEKMEDAYTLFAERIVDEE